MTHFSNQKTPAAIIDLEIDPSRNRILDMAALMSDGRTIHTRSISSFVEFLQDAKFLCGHNIIHHDLKHIEDAVTKGQRKIENAIDTLYLAPLLFPERPYHKLLKDDKLQSEVSQFEPRSICNRIALK